MNKNKKTSFCIDLTTYAELRIIRKKLQKNNDSQKVQQSIENLINIWKQTFNYHDLLDELRTKPCQSQYPSDLGLRIEQQIWIQEYPISTKTTKKLSDIKTFLQYNELFNRTTSSIFFPLLV